MKEESHQHEIKEIIYLACKKGHMCDDIEDGQILGLRSGKGLELDIVAQGIEKYINEYVKLTSKV